MDHPPPAISGVADPMDGATDVQHGCIPADSTGGDGGGHERPAGFPGVRTAPGHGAQDAGLFRAAGLPATDSTSEAPTLRQSQEETFTGVIDHILDDDHRVPKKQRHTAKRIYERLRDEYGFDGGYTIVKDYVREHRRRTREMFVPLSHPPGHAQCDFGEALVVIAGVEQKAHCFVIDLPHTDG